MSKPQTQGRGTGRSHRFLYFLSALLWCCAAVAALEAWARLWPLPEPVTPDTLVFNIEEARRLFEPIYARYCENWPFPAPEIPDYATVDFNAPAAVEDIATKRGEWTLLVNQDGMVQQVYGPPPGGLEYAHVSPPFSLPTLWEESETDALQAILDVVLSGTGHAPITATLTTATGPDVFRVEFSRVLSGEGQMRAAFHVTPSIYRHGIKRFKPNMELPTFTSTMLMEQFSTNSLGYRGPEVAVPKPEGTVRIVCIGGSTTVWGYRDKLTYPAMLQHMLRNAFPAVAEKIEVVNAGVFGMRSEEEILLVEELAPLAPDFLVYYNFINDLTMSFTPWLRPEALRQGGFERLKLRLRSFRTLDRYANTWLLPSEKLLRDMLRIWTLNNLEIITTTARAHGMQVALCSFAGIEPEHCMDNHRAYAEQINIRSIFPDLDLNAYTHIRRLYNAELRKTCERIGALYIPTAEAIQAGYELFMDECHFNPYGVEAQARVVFEHLRDAVEAALQQTETR